MADLTDLRLAAEGSGREAVLEVSGIVTWEEADPTDESADLGFRFYGRDSSLGDTDDRLFAVSYAFTRAGPFVAIQDDDVTGYIESTAQRSDFRIRVRNTKLAGRGRVWSARRFDEDRLGEDEIYAIVRVDSLTRSEMLARAATDTIRGAF
ncbi:MAG: hypothetical protein ACYTG6_16445 [Planctomycetota bacterium]|jgi:hypothetical protein